MLGDLDRKRQPSVVVLHAAETGIGGVNSMIIGLGTAQIAQFGRNSVHVLVPDNHVADYAGTAINAHVFSRKSRSLRGCAAFTLSLVRLILAHRPSFVFLHSSFAGLAGRIALVFLRPIHRPIVIYCAHGWAFTMATSDRRKRVFAWVERMLAPLTSAIVNVSDTEHRAAIQAGLPPERLHCIPNGTPRASADPGRSPYAMTAGRLNLLFVGRLDRQKGISLLLEVLESRPDLPIDLTIVGSAAIKEVGIRPLPNVTHIPWLQRQELAPYYAHADAVVVPSRWEGLPLVAAEALSYGTPVIASRVGGLASLIEDGVSGFLFDRSSPGELGRILSGLDRDRLRGMRAAAFRRWEQVADLELMNRRYLDLMRALAARPSRTSPSFNWAGRSGNHLPVDRSSSDSRVPPVGIDPLDAEIGRTGGASTAGDLLAKSTRLP